MSESMQQEFPSARVLDKLRSARLYLDSLIDAILELHAEKGEAPPALDIGVIGYRGEPGAAPDIVPLLPGSSSERVWIPLAELAEASAPLRTSGPRRWVTAEASGSAPMSDALRYAYQVVHQWLRNRSDPAPPIIVHCTDGSATDGSIDMAVRSLQALCAAGGNVTLFNCLFRGGDDPAPSIDDLCAAGETIDPPLQFVAGSSDDGTKPFLKVDSRAYRTAARLLRGLQSPTGAESSNAVETMNATRPVFVTRTLWTPKHGNADTEWEDAAASNAEHARAAVSDGASEGIFVKSWARILADSFVNDAPDIDDSESLSSWIQNSRRAWKADICYSTLRYSQQVKVDRTGGGATFLGLELQAGSGKSDEPHVWKAWAVGDACLFLVRANRLRACFPVTGSSDFGFAPALLRTLSEGRSLIPISARGTCRDGDVFVLATDAIAQRLLRSFEAGEGPDWDRYWTLDEAAWRAEIDAIRAEKGIVNDDCTLLLLRVGEPGSSTPEPAVVAESALQETEFDLPIQDKPLDEPLTDPEVPKAPGPTVARLSTGIKQNALTWLMLAVLLIAAPLRAGASPPAVDDSMVAAALTPLRKACVSDAGLRGIWIRSAAVAASGKQLVLLGFVDREEQVERLEKAVDALWDEVPAWKEAFPEGVDASALKVFPVRSKYLPNLRRDFAASDPADQPARGLLSQTRLDDVYYHAENQRLTFEGRSIDQDSYLVMQGLKEVDPRKGKPPGQLARAIDQLFRTYLRPQDIAAAELAINTSNIQFDLENPALALQRTINENPKLDDVLFQEAWFDADGTLQFGGLVASEVQRTALAGLVAKELNSGYVS
ncbi:MAG TPA: vWA domain-containing protein, partial [Isosphaeraceae bacterium]|nr:vWA domain-containing protein [Isosphaeraceae bacterium]